MKVYELKLKVYVVKDINSENGLNCVAEIIDKSLLKDNDLSGFHKANKFKNYSFNNLYPLESTKVYTAGNIYTVLIRTIDENLARHFERFLVNEYTESLKALTIEKRVLPKRYIEKIYSITPVIAKFEGGYWKTNETPEAFERRIRENLIKKYNDFLNTKLEEDFELFTFLKFENQKPISTKYKEIHILGDKLTLCVSENSTAQDLAYFALGAGILEMNSRGFGFVNYKWL